MEICEYGKATDELLLKALLKKHRKEWRREIERRSFIDCILYKKYRYEIDWDVFETAKREVGYRLLTNNKDSISKIIHQVVWNKR